MAISDELLAARLDEGQRSLGLALDLSQQQALVQYLGLLLRWNHAYNLSGIKEPERMLSLHLLDSLALVPFIDGSTILDVGSGAGLPGIPLAIALPSRQFILLDSNGKKSRFQFQAVTALGLDNVKVVNSRVENFQTSGQIDIVVTRAFSSLQQTLQWLMPILARQGRLLAMKGQYPQQEVSDIPPGFQLLAAHELDIPGMEGERHLLEIAAVKTDV
jgi:16S rRNA (guanine527-N7)-methyltransferase